MFHGALSVLKLLKYLLQNKMKIWNCEEKLRTKSTLEVFMSNSWKLSTFQEISRSLAHMSFQLQSLSKFLSFLWFFLIVWNWFYGWQNLPTNLNKVGSTVTMEVVVKWCKLISANLITESKMKTIDKSKVVTKRTNLIKNQDVYIARLVQFWMILISAYLSLSSFVPELFFLMKRNNQTWKEKVVKMTFVILLRITTVFHRK